MLDRNSHVPMYLQVKGEVVEQIKDGTFQLGDKVYSEKELCQKYDISNITAKRVLNELAQEGYISRQPGRGSFVTRTHTVSHELSRFYSFTNEVRLQGMTPSGEIVKLEVVEPGPGCQQFFDLEPGEKALMLKRKRFADGKLITLDTSMVRVEAARFVTREALQENSLYDLLRANDQAPDKAVESFDATALSAEDAELMGMKPGDAALRVNRKTTSRGRPVEYNYRYYKPNTYIYQIELNVDH